MSDPTNANSRLTKLESAVSTVATQLGDFIKESKDHRQRVEQDQERLWSAIKEQGTSLQSAVEKLSNNGRITWPVICSTLGVVLALVTAGAGVNNALMEARIKQTEIRQEYMQKSMDEKHAPKPQTTP